MSDTSKYLADNLERFQSELFDFLRIPSVSARSEHKPDMQRAADQAVALDVRAHLLPVPLRLSAGSGA